MFQHLRRYEVAVWVRRESAALEPVGLIRLSAGPASSHLTVLGARRLSPELDRAFLAEVSSVAVDDRLGAPAKAQGDERAAAAAALDLDQLVGDGASPR